MADMKLEDGIRKLVDKDPRYTGQAYFFIFEALEYTLGRMNPRRHVSGKELLEGIREFALESYGFLSRTVFYEWGITTTEDLGQIVFNLVNANLLMKNETDTLSDFRNGFDFEEAFDRGYLRCGLVPRIADRERAD